MSIFEALMLISFGVAWPVSIYKSIKSKSTKGKSFLFIWVILFGYSAGITHKLLYSKDLVLILYIINFLMVAIDLVLYIRNRRIEKKNEEQAA